MKLNPTKCAFSIESGKFLGFMIHHRNIEVNLAKAQAIVDLQPPYTVKEIHRLTKMVTTFSQFVFRSTNKCFLFFQALKDKG